MLREFGIQKAPSPVTNNGLPPFLIWFNLQVLPPLSFSGRQELSHSVGVLPPLVRKISFFSISSHIGVVDFFRPLKPPSSFDSLILSDFSFTPHPFFSFSVELDSLFDRDLFFFVFAPIPPSFSMERETCVFSSKGFCSC